MSNFKQGLENFYKNIIRMNNLVGNDFNDSSFSPLYSNLVREEIEGKEETIDSLLKQDSIGFIDGITDTLVVGYFLYKVETKDKNDVAISKEFNKYLEVNEMATYIKQNLLDCQKNIVSDNIVNIMKKTEQIAYTLENYNVDIIGIFNEVMESNFSKFPLIEDVDPDYELAYIRNQGRYTGVHYITVEDFVDGKKVKRYVFKNDKGKFIKPSCFKEPKIDLYVDNDVLTLVLELHKYLSK